MSNLLDRLDHRKMPTADVAICLDLSLLAARDAAMKELDRAHRDGAADQRYGGSTTAVSVARDAVAAIEQQIRAESITLRIIGVDRQTYNRWLVANPPRKGRSETFNSATFFMHAAKASATYVDETGAEHPILPEEWAEIDKTITDGEHDRIARAVIEVNREAGATDVSFFGSSSETTTDSTETSG